MAEQHQNPALVDVNEIMEQSQSVVGESELKVGEKRKRKPVQKKRESRAEFWVGYTEFLDENGIRRAQCKYCDKVYASDSNKVGTKNIGKHFYKCEKNPVNMGKGMQTQIVFDKMGEEGMKLKNWSYDENAVRQAIVEMVIKDEMPFMSVEKDGLKRAFSTACPQFKMPSRYTIQRDCYKLYISEREKMKDFLKKSCQRVCVTTDTWTSSNMVNYMCVTIHFVDSDWNLQKKIINFCPITSHKGQDMGRALEDCLTYWSLDKKLLTVTVDNASSNDVVCAYMSQMVKDKDGITEGNYMQMRCMAHILNLIVQDGIKQCGEHVEKLRAVIKYIRGSSSRLHSFNQQAERLRVGSNKSLRLDVCTRWNSTYDMLVSAIPYKAVFSRMQIPTVEDSLLGPLSLEEWSKTEVLANYLKVFYDVTNHISGSSFVTSNLMIFHVSKVVMALNSLAASNDPTLQNMASQMKRKCDKYWGSFDKLNLLMFVPTILDPFYKLRGVTIALQMMFSIENVDSMVTMVKDVAYKLFDRYVNFYATSESQNVGSVSNTSVEGASENAVSWLQEINEKILKGNPDRDDISNRSEFDMFLHERNEPNESDVLKWWRLNEARYPILARMARDVLAIPITTVPSESTFSTGGRHLTSYRSRLNPKNVQALICTQDWVRSRTQTNKNQEDEDSDADDTNEDDDGIFYA